MSRRDQAPDFIRQPIDIMSLEIRKGGKWLVHTKKHQDGMIFTGGTKERRSFGERPTCLVNKDGTEYFLDQFGPAKVTGPFESIPTAYAWRKKAVNDSP